MRIFLHIGTHKTGSTSIQNFCARNRELLLGQGLLYPTRHTKWNGHHQLAWSLGLQHYHKDPTLAPQHVVTGIFAEVNETSARSVLLSSEDFEFLSQDGIRLLKDYLPSHQTKVIVYLRRQDTYLESEYATHVRMDEKRLSASIFEFYMKYDFMSRYNYVRLLEPWETIFGRDAISVMPFEAEQLHRKDLLQDFCHRSGVSLTDEFVYPQTTETNVSLSAKALNVLREVNKLDLPAVERNTIIGVLEAFSARDRFTSAHERLLPCDSATDFLSIFESSNQEVARRYLGRQNGELFFERPATRN